MDRSQAAAKVYANVVETEAGCLEWQGGTYGNGDYGCVNIDGRTQAVHRVTWVAENGPVPEGLELDHTCENRICVRPGHLEAVTHEENLRRSRERGRHAPARQIGDECPEGHVLTEDNIFTETRGDRIYIRCRTCKNIDRRARYARQKVA